MSFRQDNGSSRTLVFDTYVIKEIPHGAAKKECHNFSATWVCTDAAPSLMAGAVRSDGEQEFIAWGSPAKIAREYGIRDRATVYRHAHGVGLFPKRARNVRAALERIIEQVGDVPVNAAAVVQAITAYARINAQGRLVERSEQLHLNDLFERMTFEELKTYARDGTLPRWFNRALGATPVNSSERGSDA